MEPDKISFFKDSQQLIEEYIRERLLLLKFQTAERASGILSTLIIGSIIGLLSFLIIGLITMLGLYFLARTFSNWYIAFGIVILFYGFILLVVLLKKKALNKTLTDRMISLFFTDTPISEEDART